MNASKKELMGCLVTDVQTGETIGWVKNIVFDTQGEQVAELLVDPSSRPRGRMNEERGERLVGRSLFDSASRFLGEIVDLVVGQETGKLHGLVLERLGQQNFLPAYQGLVWENDHWVLMEDQPASLRSTLFPAEPVVAGHPEPADDWMVGQIASVRLLDRRGQVIVEPGQRITPGIVEQANRAGVLHKLDADFPELGDNH